MPGGRATVTVAGAGCTPRPRQVGQASSTRRPAPAHSGQVSARGGRLDVQTTPVPSQCAQSTTRPPGRAPELSQAAHGDWRSTRIGTATPPTAWSKRSSTEAWASSPRRPWERGAPLAARCSPEVAGPPPVRSYKLRAEGSLSTR
jgi:hypothetical protein